MAFQTLLIPIIFLLGASSLSAWTKALQILGRIQSKEECTSKPYFYLPYTIVKKILPKDRWNNLFYLLSGTKHLLRLLYATTLFYFFLSLFTPLTPPKVVLAIIIVVGIGITFDSFTRFSVNINPLLFLKCTTPLTTLFFLLFLPITLLFLKAQSLFLKKRFEPMSITRATIKDKILELVQETELSVLLEAQDKRLITSVASFRDRIVREIMVPRIDIFSLSVDQTVHEAAQKFISEGYSRIPIYQETVDNIVGVLLYKDVMNFYIQSFEKKESSPLETPLKQLIKPVLYTPETKKISKLLQEFRGKQIHLAIVVDEYGGTEGIITIEDILEELVGEIADEYDIAEEEKLYLPHPEKGWIVDAKMNILDIEKELGISIPPSPEYDTIGGYVFHRAGTIPSKGWRIHHEHFDLEVVSTSERAIEKVVITPLETLEKE
jgi:putative hemolysin